MAARTPTVYLHIGPPKTGTTFIQQVLWRNRKVLRGQGVMLPGSEMVDHFYAALDLRGIAFGGYDNPATVDAWPRLANAARAQRSDAVVISHEAFAGSRPDEIARLVSDLAPARIELIYAARDLGRQLPAVWQESLKNRSTKRFETFLARALATGKEDSARRGFWRAQHPVRTLRRWEDLVPAEQIHVVTLPPAGAQRDVLWWRFAAIVDLDPAAFDLDVARPNRSLGAIEAELLRRLNGALDPSVPWPDYEALVKARFSRLADSSAANGLSDHALRVPERYRDRVLDLSAQISEQLTVAGYDICGDLADLTPTDDSFGPMCEPEPDRVADAAVSMLAAALAEQRAVGNSPVHKARQAMRKSRSIRRLRGQQHQ